jgi:5-methylcytosine-specific restriction endonuclease McrA
MSAKREHTTNDPTYRANRKHILANNPNCHWCGQTADTADHLVEFDQGGDNSTDNLVPACRSCNSKRGAIYVNKKTQQRINARNNRAGRLGGAIFGNESRKGFQGSDFRIGFQK